MQQYLRQEQKLKLSPAFYHSMQVLSLDIIDLEQEIAHKLEENPALELLDDHEPLEYASSDDHDSMLELLYHRNQSLQDHLLEQLGWLSIGDKTKALAALIIQNLDEKGFHQANPATLHPLLANSKQLAAILVLVRQLDPIGCATENSFESLTVQLNNDALYGPYSASQLEKAAALWATHQITELSNLLLLPTDEIDDFFLYLKTLKPYPGLLYGESHSRVIYPELSVTTVNQEVFVTTVNRHLPSLTLNPFFKQLASLPADTEGYAYAKEQLHDAERFINSLKLREQTLLKVAKAVATYQKDFFIKGSRYLKPLTLKQIATELDLHETTVSRAVAGKYIQTSTAIISLKSLFSGGMVNIYGQNISREVIKNEIGAIIEASGDKKISDQKIVAILNKMGHQIARRTVAKYRGELVSKR